MNKQEFLQALKEELSGLPLNNIEDSLNFYSEMIDDKIEDGLTEEQAVLEVGSPNVIASQIIQDIPFIKTVKEKIKPSRDLEAWEIALLIVCSPIWLTLIISACSVIFSLYVAYWSVVISLWAVFVSFIVSFVAGIISGFVLVLSGKVAIGFALVGAGLFLLGIAIFTYYGCKIVTKWALLLIKKISIFLKRYILKRGARND